MLGAWIFNHLGWPALFVAYAGAYLVAGSMWLLIDPRKQFYQSSSAAGAFPVSVPPATDATK